jgi:hypothetical protein
MVTLALIFLVGGLVAGFLHWPWGRRYRSLRALCLLTAAGAYLFAWAVIAPRAPSGVSVMLHLGALALGQSCGGILGMLLKRRSPGDEDGKRRPGSSPPREDLPHSATDRTAR